MGHTFWPSLTASKSTRFWPVWNKRDEIPKTQASVLHTRLFLISITWLHLPVTSPMSRELCRTRPMIALYVPEKNPYENRSMMSEFALIDPTNEMGANGIRLAKKGDRKLICRHTLVLNSRSQDRLCFSFFAVHVSPNSNTIFPNRMPRAYMLGIVMTYSKMHQRETRTPPD